MLEKNIVYYKIIDKKELKTESNSSDTKKARYLLEKMLLSFNIELPEIYNSINGKPYFKNSNIYFNYSHSKNYIACAISLEEVGIDIEETNRIISDMIAIKYLDNVTNNNKRIETWVKKEAYSKLKGLGLKIKIQNIKLAKIKENNILISNNNYICSIFSSNNKSKFKEIKSIM